MNAGIVILQDGSPCIAFDDELPHDVDHVEFNHEDYKISLVFDTDPVTRKTFEFPLDHPFVDLLKELGTVTIARAKGDQLIDIQILSINFIAN